MAIGKKVKGITVEFNGDTTKLGKAISDIDKKTKSLDQQLSEVNRSLKFNPGNTELLAQKQKLLGDKVSETKTRLEALKDAQAKLDDDPAVDKTSQDYMELRREIIETESKLKRFEGQLKAIDNVKFEKVGKQVQNVGDKMETVGDGMTKYVTGPIVAGAGLAVKAFKEVDAGIDIVVAKTGASGEALEGMKESVKNLTTTIPTDFETAGTAIGEVNTRFGLTGKALEDLSGKFIKFADLNSTDVNNAIDMTQKALSNFGLSAEDAEGLLDQLNQVGQNTGVSMETLLSGLVDNGTAFQQLGLDAGQAATLMGQLEVSGANADTVMQGLRKALKKAAEDGVPLDQALADLQDTILNGTDGMDGLTAAYDLFGKSGDQIYGAVKNGTIDFSNLGAAAEDAAGSVDKTFEETLDPVDKFNMAMNGLKGTGYEVGSVLLDTFAPVIQKIADKIKEFAEKWQGLSPQMQQTIVKAALITAAFGPVLSIIGRLTMGLGGLITAIPKLISGFGAIGKAIGALSKLLMANPWAIVTAAAIAAIVLIYKNWDKIKEFFAKLWEAIKVVAKAAWDGIKNMFKAVFEAIKLVITTYINIWKKIFKTAFGIIKNYIVNPIKNAVRSVKEQFDHLKLAVGMRISLLQKKVKEVFDKIKSHIIDPIKNAKAKVVETIGALKDALAEKIDTIKSTVSDKFKAIKDAILGPIRTARDKIKEIIDKIKGFFDFEFKIPKIKLPHISVSPAGWSIGDIFDGVIPSLDIDWYAKGGIFKTPQVVGIGDVRGGEAALPLEPFWERFDQMADRIVSAVSGGGTQNGAAVFQGSIVIDGQVVANVITPIVNRGLQRQAAMDGRNA